MKKLTYLMLVSVVILSVLAGCAAPVAPAATAPDSGDAAAAPATWRDQDFSGVTIKVGVPEMARETIEAAGKEFNEATGGAVEVVYVSGSVWREKMLQELVAETGALDVMDISPWWFGDFAPYILPIDDFLADPSLTDADFDSADIIPALWDEYAKGPDGQLYGIPFWASSVVLYYRTDLFNDPDEQAAFKEKYGHDLAPPRTWEEWEHIAEFFHRPEEGLYGSALMGKRAYNINVPITDRFFGLGAPDWLDENGKPLIYSQPELMTQAFEQYLKSAQWANPDYLSTEYFETTNTFIQGLTAMAEQWNGAAYNDAQDPTKSKVVGNVAIAPLPEGGGLGGGHFWAIAKDTPNPEAAWAFLQLMASKEYVKEFLLNDGVDPGRFSVYEDPEVQEYYGPGYGEALSETLASSHQPIMNKTPYSTALWEALILRTSEVIAEEKTPEEATAALVEDWKKIVPE